jgi:hypothetical protein
MRSRTEVARSVDRVLGRTRRLLARRSQLAEELDGILSECARTRRQSPRTIWGGTRPEADDALRHQVRAWLAEGRLPMPGAEVWVGAGSDRECVICSAAITRAQIEYEIPSGDDWLSVHLGCFTLWKSEAAALRGKASADGAAAAD